MSERSVSRRRQAKHWYDVLAPELFDREQIGQTPADEPELVPGRTIVTTLGELTNNASENNTKLTFKITEVSSDAAYTEFIKHELTRDYLRSLVRRGASKIDATLTVRTSDDYRVKVQPVAFTTKKSNHSQERAIRKRMVEMVQDAAADRTYESFMDGVVRGRLSSAIYAETKTIYPLRRVEVQKAELLARPDEIAEEEATSVDVEEEDVAVDAEED